MFLNSRSIQGATDVPAKRVPIVTMLTNPLGSNVTVTMS